LVAHVRAGVLQHGSEVAHVLDVRVDLRRRPPVNRNPATRGSPEDRQDVSIGYLAHDTTSVQLYFQETLTFLVYTAEAAVTLSAPSGQPVEAGAA
jgi:hypothetical protein